MSLISGGLLFGFTFWNSGEAPDDREKKTSSESRTDGQKLVRNPGKSVQQATGSGRGEPFDRNPERQNIEAVKKPVKHKKTDPESGVRVTGRVWESFSWKGRVRAKFKLSGHDRERSGGVTVKSGRVRIHTSVPGERTDPLFLHVHAKPVRANQKKDVNQVGIRTRINRRIERTEGGFVLNRIPAGTYDMRFKAPNYAPVTAEGVYISPDTEERMLEIEFHWTPGTEGIVVDTSTRVPLKDTRIHIYRDIGTRSQPVVGEWVTMVTSDELGKFAVPFLGRGDYLMIVQKKGYTSRTIEFSSGSSRDRSFLELSLSSLE